MRSSSAFSRGISEPGLKGISGALGVLLIGLAACAASNQNAPTTVVPPNYYASGTAVCGLLGEHGLEAILGHRFMPGTADFNPDTQTLTGISTCSYGNAEPKVADPGLSPQANAFLASFPKVYLGVVYAYGDQIYNQHRALLLPKGRPHVGKSVRGIGKEAFWWPNTTQFFVLAKGKMLALQFRPEVLETEDQVLNRGRRLATKAIERLR